jgi:hypothetical protein
MGWNDTSFIAVVLQPFFTWRGFVRLAELTTEFATLQDDQ